MIRELKGGLLAASIAVSCSADSGRGLAVGGAADTSILAGDESNLSPEAWGVVMTDAWKDLLEGREQAAVVAVEGMVAGQHRLDWTQEFLDADSAALSSGVDAFPLAPSNQRLSVPYGELVTAIEVLLTANQDLHTRGSQDPEGVRLDLDSAGGDLPSADYGSDYIHLSELDSSVTNACFVLQQAMSDANLALLDCTGSAEQVDSAPVEDAGPNSTAVTTLSGSNIAVLPGVYELSTFESIVSVETSGELVISTADQSLGFGSPDGATYFEIVNPAWVDPSSFGDGRAFTDAAYGTAPNDLERWIGALPVTLAQSGFVQVGPDQYPYWDLQHRPELFEPEVIVAIFRGSLDSGGAAGVVLVEPNPDATTRVLAWNRAGKTLLIYWYFDADSADAQAEFFGLVMAGVR